MLGLKSGSSLGIYAFLLLKLVLLIITAFLTVKYVILPLFLKFDIIQEYIFLVSLGWCLLYSELANHLSISYEMGAFIAGLSLASSPVAWNIAEKLKPLQEFFIILFFFSIGANFDISVTKSVLVPGIIVAVVILIIKPLVFKISFTKIGENSENSKELGLRLGQASEFSLLLISSALYVNKVTPQAVYLVNLATIITFIFSTYLVVKKYPTPITPK
jgi:Kef-type K+ transport system membrane component KefB